MMKFRVKITKGEQKAEITVDSDDPIQVEKDIRETVRKFPERFGFTPGGKNEDVIIKIEQVG